MPWTEELFQRACEFVMEEPARNQFNGPLNYGITNKQLESLHKESGRSKSLVMISYQNPNGARDTQAAVKEYAGSILAFRVRPNDHDHDSLFELLPKYFAAGRPYECRHRATIESEVRVDDGSDDTYKVDVGLWKRTRPSA